MTKSSVVEPHVDPQSSHGHIVVTRGFLLRDLGGKQNDILRAHFISESIGGPKLYWFEDCVAVRKELGMEPKEQA